MEPSQETRPLSDKQFARAISSPKGDAVLSPEAQRNRGRASENLAHIFGLRDSADFDWYLKEGLVDKLRQADRELKNGDGKETSVEIRLARWTALAELHDWLINLEIVGRKALDKNDPEIPILSAKLVLQ